MTGYDYEKPYIDKAKLDKYVAIDRKAARYGRIVRAAPLSNVEYKLRFERLKDKWNMMPPPSCGRIFGGYLVIRNLGTPGEYETWMPEHVFEELYEADSELAPSDR